MKRSQKRMRQASPGLAARRREYAILNREFAARPENWFCPVAREGLIGLPLTRPATDTHHKDGRNGKNLIDFSKCIRVSRAGHEWIRDHGREARRMGWLI